MILRAELAGQLDGPLPAGGCLPEGYPLPWDSDHEECSHCGGRLRHKRTSVRQPVGLLLGRPRVRCIEKECVRCGKADSFDAYHRFVPAHGNYAFDLMVEVGLARLRDLRQDTEICRDIRRRWGVSLPVSAVGLLVDSFLDGLAAVHQARAPLLRRRIERDGGYVLHVDGTCEPGTDVAFAAVAAPRRWVLEVGKMTTENANSIAEVLSRVVGHWGIPSALMRDMSQNIKNAKQQVLPEVPDFICQYHFLENVGEKLCRTSHGKLTSCLRRVRTRAALNSIRKDLIRWSKQESSSLTTEQVEQLLANPSEAAEMDASLLRRLAAYLVLRWLDDFGADLHGEYFPFDLPSLAFYRRGRRLSEWLDGVIASEDFPRRGFSTLETIARHLAPLREDPELTAAAQRLEKASALFEELRGVLRLTHTPRERTLRTRKPVESGEQVQQIAEDLTQWREALQNRFSRERDPDKREDEALVLKYLETYHQELTGHVLPAEPRREPLVVDRTNNLLEQLFGVTKKGLRRRVGTKRLKRFIQAMRPEALLVPNLGDPLYLDFVCGGDLANLPTRLSEHWPLAKALRHERQQPKKDHPLPTSKRVLRQPEMLDNLTQLVRAIIRLTAEKSAA